MKDGECHYALQRGFDNWLVLRSGRTRGVSLPGACDTMTLRSSGERNTRRLQTNNGILELGFLGWPGIIRGYST